MTYRKIGGIHWLALGRLRISWCLKRDASRDASTSTCASPLGMPTAAGPSASHKWDWLDWAMLSVVSCGVGLLMLTI